MVSKNKNKEVDLDEVLEDFDDAEVDSRRPKLKTGLYPLLEVESVMFKDGHNGLSFIIEATLGQDADNGEKAGRKVSMTINGWDKKDQKDRALGRLKAFLGACFKKDPTSKQRWTDIAKLCIKDNTKIRGKQIKVQSEVIESNGFDFVNWQPEVYEADDAAA